jgi:hypothetical protein
MGGIVFFNNVEKLNLNLNEVLKHEYDVHGPLPAPPYRWDDWRIIRQVIRRELKALLRNVTRDEITDRSKCDALSKAIVLVQTTWFTFQCVARAVQGLAVTELEIVTLAYAALNGVMCFFWWKKPLDVQCPIVIELSGTELVREIPFEPSDSGSSTTLDPESQPLIGEQEAEVSKSTWLHSLKSPLCAIAPIGVLRKVSFTSDVLDSNGLFFQPQNCFLTSGNSSQTLVAPSIPSESSRVTVSSDNLSHRTRPQLTLRKKHLNMLGFL